MLSIKAKPLSCKECQTVIGYTHKNNPIPTVYCPKCAEVIP